MKNSTCSPQPLAVLGVGQDLVDDAFEHEAGHHLAAMMPAGEGDAMLGLAVEPAEQEQLHVALLLRLAQRLDLEVRVLLVALEEMLAGCRAW